MIKNKLKIIAMLCVLVCVGLSVLFLNSSESYTFKNGGKTFIKGVEFTIDEGMRAVFDNDSDIVYFRLSSKNKVEANAMPAYTSETDFVVMDKLSLYVPGNDGKFVKKRIGTFTQASYDDLLKEITFARKGKTKIEKHGFLYDGHSTFIFLDEMTLTYDGRQCVLHPMSCAIVSYHNWVRYYDPVVDDYVYENVRGDVMVEDKVKDYSINIANHTVKYEDRETILISNINSMEDYFFSK